jgi:hypothetical protein
MQIPATFEIIYYMREVVDAGPYIFIGLIAVLLITVASM